MKLKHDMLVPSKEGCYLERKVWMYLKDTCGGMWTIKIDCFESSRYIIII